MLNVIAHMNIYTKLTCPIPSVVYFLILQWEKLFEIDI